MMNSIKLSATVLQVFFIPLNFFSNYAFAMNLTETPTDKVEILKKNGLVPDIMKDPPKHVLYGYYGQKDISFGNLFYADEIARPPKFLDWPVVPRGLYTLVMTGLDAPSKEKPKLRQWRHWLVGNIPLTNISRGQEILPYMGTGHFYQKGIHRIAFIVYLQPGKRKIKFYERNLRKQPLDIQRGNYSNHAMVKKYGLKVPVAANFLRVETDELPPTTTDFYNATIESLPPGFPEDFTFKWDPKDLGLTNPF